MRTLVVEPGPNFSVQDVARGWTKALGEITDVQAFDLGGRLTWYEIALAGKIADTVELRRAALNMANEDLRAAVFDWWPEVVIIVSGMFLTRHTMDMIRARKIPVVALLTESPYEDVLQLEVARHADLAILNDPTNIDAFRQVTNAVYYPHAYDPDVHRPHPVADRFRCDFVFAGTGYPSRIEFFEQVDFAGVDAAFVGNWEGLEPDSPLRKLVAHDIGRCCENSEVADWYAGAKASVNVYRTEAADPALSDGWAMGPREVELAATGCFFLTQPRGENQEVLSMVPTFEDPIDLSEQLRWWLANDKQRAQVARLARAAVADRTFDNHAKRLLTSLGL